MNEAEFTAKPWPPLRDVLALFLRQNRPYNISGFSEIDMTNAKALLDEIKALGDQLSLNTYLVYVTARAAVNNPQTLSFKRGRKLIFFSHANISLAILKKLPNGLEIPVLYTVKAADQKSLSELNRELRDAIEGDLTSDKNVKNRRFLSKCPRFVQRFVYWYIFRDPLRINQHFGNIGLTNVRLADVHNPFIGFPPNVYTAQIAITGVLKKILPNDSGAPEARDVLSVASSVDHLTMDGIAVAKFAKDFNDMIEQAEGLKEYLEELQQEKTDD